LRANSLTPTLPSTSPLVPTLKETYSRENRRASPAELDRLSGPRHDRLQRGRPGVSGRLGWQQAVGSGLWAQGVNRVGTNGWKQATEAKSANYGVGFSAGANNFNSAIAKVINALQSGVSSLPPRGDINANLQRANALALYMHGLKGQLGA
jgi:hypothetical protein